MKFPDIILERYSERKLNIDTNKKKLKRIAGVFGRNAQMGYEGKIVKIAEPVLCQASNGTQQYRNLVYIAVKHSCREEVALERYNKILPLVKRTASTFGWTVISEEQLHKPIGEVVTDAPDEVKEDFVLPPLDEAALTTFFAHIYEREAHLRIIHAAMETLVESKGEDRSHILLWGKPSAAKTLLFIALKEMYEQNCEQEHIIFIDGPTMSKAGLENWIIEKATIKMLPEVIVIEEIEKQPMDNLLTLLSIMASGYVAKTNARIGKVREDAKCLIFATCNDKTALEKFREGALFSRFTHTLKCERPSRELMWKILVEKIQKRNGNIEWANKCLELADTITGKTNEKFDDPRKIIGFLDGKDRLLDGSYQKDILNTIGI